MTEEEVRDCNDQWNGSIYSEVSSLKQWVWDLHKQIQSHAETNISQALTLWLGNASWQKGVAW